MKFTFKTGVLFLLVLLCTAFIFSNSLKNIEQSYADSDIVAEIVEDVSNKIKPENEWNWRAIVRKSAHAIEFFALGCFSVLFFMQIQKKRVYAAIFSALYAAIISFSDEYIQSFSNRASSLNDVKIDFLGASIGILIVLLVNRMIEKRRKAPKKIGK